MGIIHQKGCERMKPLLTGIIGAGAISGVYLTNLTGRFAGFTDVRYIAAGHLENAVRKADEYGLTALTAEELISREDIEMVVILTPVETHGELIRKCLLAGKHVYTEKTITVHSEEAMQLLALAQERNLYLGCAPDTFLGSMVQTGVRALQNDLIWDVHSFGIMINRDNDLLTSMFSFLRQKGAGILRDYVVYYLTALVTLLGPVETVGAFTAAPYEKRLNILPSSKEYMQEIDTPNEAITSVTVKMKNGIIGVIHDDSETTTVDHSVFNIYGRKGILKLGNANNFGDDILLVKKVMDYRHPEETLLERENEFSGNERGLGAAEMAQAIREGRPQRASGLLAIHVLQVIEAIEKSAASGQFVSVNSNLNQPEYFSGL